MQLFTIDLNCCNSLDISKRASAIWPDKYHLVPGGWGLVGRNISQHFCLIFVFFWLVSPHEILIFAFKFPSVSDITVHNGSRLSYSIWLFEAFFPIQCSSFLFNLNGAYKFPSVYEKNNCSQWQLCDCSRLSPNPTLPRTMLIAQDAFKAVQDQATAPGAAQLKTGFSWRSHGEVFIYNINYQQQ